MKVSLLIRTCLAALVLLWSQAQAQTYPERQVRLIVPFPPGGGSDTQARRLAERLSLLWKQSVVVENISGAGGTIAAATTAHAKPDGYTVLFATHPILSTYPFLYKKLNYDPADLVPVVAVTTAPLVLLVPSSTAIHSLADLLRKAKEQPGRLNFGSGGIGTSQHLAGELLKEVTGIDIVHVPYRGTAQTSTALMVNDIQINFDNVQSAKTQIRSGRVRGIAITSRDRLPTLPNIPTINETLPGFESTLSYGLLLPAGTPAAVVEVVNRDVNKVLQDPSYAKWVTDEGLYLQGGTPAQFQDYVVLERNKWGPLLRRLNIRLE